MRIATLDFPVPGRSAASLSFAAPAALAGFDALVWLPAAIAEGARDAIEGEDAGRPVLRPAASELLLARSREWRTELRHFLQDGGALVVFVPPADVLGVHTLQEVVSFDPLETLPVDAGTRRNADRPAARLIARGEPFHGFVAAAGGALRPRALLDRAPGRTVIVTDEGCACASYQYLHPGHLLLLPAPSEDAAPQPLFDAIVALVRRLCAPGRLSKLHPIADGIDLAGERADRMRAAALSEERARIDAELAAVRARIETAELVKQLVAGDRRGVSRASAFVLHALGAYTQAGMADDDSVAFEHRLRSVVLTLVDERITPARRWIATAQARTAAWSAERTALLFCADNHLPLGERKGPDPAFVAAAREAGIAVLTAEALLAAYEARDAGLLDRLIA